MQLQKEIHFKVRARGFLLMTDALALGSNYFYHLKHPNRLRVSRLPLMI